MDAESISLTWTSTYSVAISPNTDNLPGDKILLPPSALEQLLSASTIITSGNHPSPTPYDPYNPYSLAAARQEASRWRDTQQQLPHPLTFRLVNPTTGNVVYAGIREFSAEEGYIGLSPFLLQSLGIKREANNEGKAATDSSIANTLDSPIDLTNTTSGSMEELAVELDRIVVHAKQLPKGTYVRLRPLEAGYNPDDWKALLEKHLRDNYTTLTNGEVLTVPGGRDTKAGEFRFLIDKFVPEGEGICVVDTDLEVDIEALNEEQARETLKQIIAKSQKASGTAEGSSVGGTLDVWNAVDGQVVEGEYVDYQLPSWDRSQGLEIEIILDDSDEVDLFVSPLSAHQRSKPRDDEHVFGDFTIQKTSKKIRLQASNIELGDAEALYISVHAYRPPEEFKTAPDTKPRPFSLRARIIDKTSSTVEAIDLTDDVAHATDEEQCKNCLQWVPKRTMMLHENFCFRNRILCPHCKDVFMKSSSEWKNHWHCPHDTAHGNSPETQLKHNHILHTDLQCPSCPYRGSMPNLARHRTTVCPGKLILCQFCHLIVPQEGDPFAPSADALLSGLTAHEIADGARTTNCHLCQAIVRLRDMQTHLKHHDLSRQSKSRPRICRNVNCGRTLDGVGKNGDVGAKSRIGQGPGNELGLCSICFGPLYVSMHDPEGKAMKRRIERRYIGQLITGCGKPWCRNEICKLGRKHVGISQAGEVITTKEALPMVKPLMEGLTDTRTPMHFCVDEASQKRRLLAQMLAAEKQYEFEWCIAACEAEMGNLDSARGWLRDWAPQIGEN